LSADEVYIDAIDLRAADINISAAKISGASIGDLVRRHDRLIQVGVCGASCFRCGEPLATQARGKISWEPLCGTHGFAGEWISDAARRRKVEELVRSGASPSVVAAYFNFAIKRGAIGGAVESPA
jgi:hypothetical protein